MPHGRNFLDWVVNQARWNVVTDNLRSFMTGLYPIDQGWRVALAMITLVTLAGISWGVWGRMVASIVVTLVIGVVLLVLLPMLNTGGSWADGEGIGRFLGGDIIALVRVLQAPLLLIILFLAVGYAVGRFGVRLNKQPIGRIVLIGWFVAIPLSFVLVRGLGVGTPVLPYVSPNSWGGLLLTFMLAFVAITACFPLGILLALGRASGLGARKRPFKGGRWWWLNPLQWVNALRGWWSSLGTLPIIKLACTVFIEFMRGVPLVTVFFTANVIVPLALGGDIQVDNVVRAMVALTLFEAAYVAEIVRGGLQAVPPGQLEAARAIGLNPIQATLFIILPQAIRTVIPTLVGQFISLFKDTSLAVIIGLLELIGTAQSIYARQEFNAQRREVLVFIALVYFVFSYGMSYAARQLERQGSGKAKRT